VKLKKLFVNLSVLAISAVLGLIACEFGSRFVLNRADYLSVQMVQDDVLGATPLPTAKSGFDTLGFRNADVPKTVDIVAIGDSHTYGNTARMEDSWPYVLGRLTGSRVYNMGMGGYGPNQYYHLLKTRALALKPRLIIVGLYMGDDFENAYSITYGLDHWAYLREQTGARVDVQTWDPPASDPSWHKKARVWLSQHSVVYQLIFHGALGGRVQGEAQIANAQSLYPGVATSLLVPDKNIKEAFRPVGLLRRLDQTSPNVREGMRITFRLLKEMNELCKQNHIDFVVVVIPTKETVFADYLEQNSKLPMHDVVADLIRNERVARSVTFQTLSEQGIPYVDTLPALTKSVEQQLYARTASDMHPGKNGYRVIAEAVFRNLPQSPKPALQSSK
jgi:hypothetical protein